MPTMDRIRQDQHNAHSEDELNEQINEKLSELWTGMRHKRKQMLRNLTPGYSRRSQRTLSQLNATHNQTNLTNTIINTNSNNTTEHQLLKIKEKLVSQQSDKKLKQTQIQKLKHTISQLTNDKKILIKEIQNLTNHSISVSHINNLQQHEDEVDGRTANFYPKQKNKKPSDLFGKRNHTSYPNNSSLNKENRINTSNNCNTNVYQSSSKQNEKNTGLEDLTKARLIQLLRSTSEYRQFAFYYDSHQLSYLKRLQQQHKKNCQNNYSSLQKRYWAPLELVQKIKAQNHRLKWGLSQGQIQQVISEMKTYFEANQETKIKQTKQFYTKKIQKLKRDQQNKLPYDLVRLSCARQRQMCKKRSKTIKS